MIITTIGSEAWPRSLEGRLLCLALAIYAFSVFGYVTAALASFLIARGKSTDGQAGDRLEQEMIRLREEVERLLEDVKLRRCLRRVGRRPRLPDFTLITHGPIVAQSVQFALILALVPSSMLGGNP